MSLLNQNMNQGSNAACAQKAHSVLHSFYPDYTVGPGITPDLLVHHYELSAQKLFDFYETAKRLKWRARGLYRRWGITPRPEFIGTIPTRQAYYAPRALASPRLHS